MRAHGVFQDSDTERPDPNLPDTWEFKRAKAAKMEEEDDELYGDAEKSVVFRSLNARDPAQARRRLGTLFWKGWKRVLFAFFLTAFGLTFTVIGICCMFLCDEADRGVGFAVVGALTLMPGLYGSLTLWFYLRGEKGYHYKDLPEMQ